MPNTSKTVKMWNHLWTFNYNVADSQKLLLHMFFLCRNFFMVVHKKHCFLKFFSDRLIGSDNWNSLVRQSGDNCPWQLLKWTRNLHFSTQSVVYCQKPKILCSSSHQEVDIISQPHTQYGQAGLVTSFD